MGAPTDPLVPPPSDVPPPPPYTTEVSDSSIVEQWDVPSRTYRRYDCGVLVLQRPFTPQENASADAQATAQTRSVNQATLLQRARAAVVNNQAYLDKVTAGTATTADHIGQVPALTRQMQGVIRLIVGSDLLDQITGT